MGLCDNMKRTLPLVKVYPVCNIFLEDLPKTIGVNKEVAGEIKRWYYQAEEAEITKWLIGQLQTECHVIITGSIPPWLGTVIGWNFGRHPLVKSLTVRASLDKQGFLVGTTFEDDT